MGGTPSLCTLALIENSAGGLARRAAEADGGRSRLDLTQLYVVRLYYVSSTAVVVLLSREAKRVCVCVVQSSSGMPRLVYV